MSARPSSAPTDLDQDEDDAAKEADTPSQLVASGEEVECLLRPDDERDAAEE